MLVTSICSFSHNYFYPCTDEFQFLSHLFCRQFWQIKKFVAWLEVNQHLTDWFQSLEYHQEETWMKEEEEGLQNDLNLNLLNEWNQIFKLQQNLKV